MEFDYSQVYNLESYLFNQLSKKFETTQKLSTEDFFCIIIWKSNRAKSKIAKKIMNISKKDLNSSVKELIEDIVCSKSEKDKLNLMLDKWKFGLPMASAILSVLYPNKFSIYDYRVCDMLNKFHNIKNLKTNKMTDCYFEFLKEVTNKVPERSSFRDKDKFLWGKSFYLGLKEDIKNEFKKRKDLGEE